MKSKLKTVSLNLLIAIMALVIFSSACTNYQNLKDDSLVVKTKNDEIHLSKATIGKACDNARAHCLDDVLIILGKISDATLKDLDTLAKTHGDKAISAVCFNTPGGDVHAAKVLGLRILQHKLSTCMAETYFIHDKNGIPRQLINTKCNSACNFLLLASNKRIAIGHDYDIATHSAGISLSFCFCSMPVSWGIMNSFKFQSLLDRDDNPDKTAHLDFLQLSKHVGFDEAYYLTSADLEKFAIFTEYYQAANKI